MLKKKKLLYEINKRNKVWGKKWPIVYFICFYIGFSLNMSLFGLFNAINKYTIHLVIWIGWIYSLIFYFKYAYEIKCSQKKK